MTALWGFLIALNNTAILWRCGIVILSCASTEYSCWQNKFGLREVCLRVIKPTTPASFYPSAELRTHQLACLPTHSSDLPNTTRPPVTYGS